MKNILVDLEVNPAGLERLRAVPGVNVVVTEPALVKRALPKELIADKHAWFGTYPPLNLTDMESLEFVQIGSTGYAQLYDLGLVERGIRACNGRGAFDVTIAEWNLAMMINLLRDVRGMIRHQEHGIWDRSARFQSELRGLNVGIWGYGGIGRATARVAKVFGLNVHVLARSGVGPRGDIYQVPGSGDAEGTLPDKVFTAGQEHEFLSGLDFLIVAVPQTPLNNGMIGETELAALPSRAFVLNPARGPIIQEEALLKALREGTIAGAALDAHYHYPMPADHPLWRFPNVIMTPHISGSGASPHYLERIWDIFVQNVERLVKGQPLLNELSTSQLEGR